MTEKFKYGVRVTQHGVNVFWLAIAEYSAYILAVYATSQGGTVHTRWGNLRLMLVPAGIVFVKIFGVVVHFVKTTHES